MGVDSGHDPVPLMGSLALRRLVLWLRLHCDLRLTGIVSRLFGKRIKLTIRAPYKSRQLIPETSRYAVRIRLPSKDLFKYTRTHKVY